MKQGPKFFCGSTCREIRDRYINKSIINTDNLCFAKSWNSTTMTKSTIIEIANMAPEGVGTIDLSTTALLIIDMQVRRHA